MTTIKLKNGSGAPTAGDLVQGEPALDLTNKRLYTEDSGGTVIEVGTNPGTDVTFADNRKAIFGASSDLQIYHDGSNSYIDDQGTGGLYVRSSSNMFLTAANGEKYFKGTVNGAATLYYDDAEKLATTSTGIDVTGTATVDGLDVANVKIESDLTTTPTNDGANYIFRAASGHADYNGGDLIIQARSSASRDIYMLTGTTTPVNRFKVDGGGDISFYEDTGTTAKLFWDASAESLGIGTTSPGTKLSVVDTSAQAVQLSLQNSGRDWRIGPNSGVGSSSLVFYDNTASQTRLVIDSSGQVGIGTSSPDGTLHVNSGSAGTITAAASANNLVVENNGPVGLSLLFDDAASNAYGNIYWGNETDGSADGRITYFGSTYVTAADRQSMEFRTAGTARMRIDSSGNVGIGTSSPDAVLTVSTSSSSDVLKLKSSASTTPLKLLFEKSASEQGIIEYNRNGDLELYNTDTDGGVLISGSASADPDFYVAHSGNVGIGTSSPAYNLVVSNGGASGIEFGPAYSGTANLIQHYSRSGAAYVDAVNDAAQHRFNISGTEKARIDSSGNLLVGKTSADNTTAGIRLLGSVGFASFVRDGAEPVVINRLTSDGDLIDFRKDGTTVGSIGTSGGSTYIGGYQNAGLYFNGTTDVRPWNTSTQANLDNSVDLGNSSSRFKDLYLSGGVRGTSTIDITVPETSGGAINLEFGNNVNTTRRTVRAYKDNFEPVAADTGVISLGQATNKWKDLYLSGTSYIGSNLSLLPSGSNSEIKNASGVLYYKSGQHNFQNAAGTTEYGRFDTSGNFMVGLTSAPTANEGGVFVDPVGTIKTSRNGTSAKTHIQFFNDNGAVGSISTSASATAFNTSSDQRLKDNIVDAPSASDDIDAIQVRSFDWKAGGSHQKYGMVAQELQSVAPEAVTGDADSDDMMGIDYSKLVPMMMKEIQSLRARVAQLEGEN